MPQSTVARRELLVTGGLLFAAVVAFFWPAVLGGRVLLPANLIYDLDPLWQPLASEAHLHPTNPALSDQIYQFYPWQIFAARSLAQGYVPLWNPYVNGGQAFVGNALSGMFSPFDMLSYLLPVNATQVVTIILRMLLAGMCTFLFAREIGLRKPGALLAAAAFVFSGPVIGWIGFPPSHTVLWLPAMLLTIEIGLTKKSFPYLALSGLVVGAQFLEGQPESSLHVTLTWGAYALYRAATIAECRLSALWTHLGRIAFASTAGLGLGMVQLLPFLGALLGSATLPSRQAEAALGLPILGRLFFDWHEWPTAITAMLPQYFGSPLDDSYWFPYSNYIEQNVYAGTLPLALAIAAALHGLRDRGARNRTQVLFFVLLAATSLGIALRLPLFNAVNALPPFNVAANGRLRLVYVFAVSILAGQGLDALVDGRARYSRTTAYIVACGALASLALIAVTYLGFVLFKDQIVRSGYAYMEANWGTPNFPRPLEYYYRLVEARYARKLAMFLPANWVMYLPIWIAACWLGLRRWGQRFGSKGLAAAALSLTTLDLFLTGGSFNTVVRPEDVFPTPGSVAFLQQDGSVFRISATGLILNPNTGMLYELSDVRGYDAIVPGRYVELMRRLPGHVDVHFHSLFVESESRLLDLLNVKYVLTDQELGLPWELAYQDAGPVKVYRNPRALPRAFVVHRVQVVPDAARSLDVLTDESFDFRTRVVLEEAPRGWIEPTEVPAAPATVMITDYEPNRVRLQVDTPASSVLVLTDNYAPGWRALVDGERVRVYVADHAFRAVAVPPGAHQVTFIYSPPWFWAGATASLSTALTLLISAVVRWVRRRNTTALSG